MSFISSEKGISKQAQNQNALEIYRFFTAQGWSLPAVCAMLGNMVCESGINPGRWEGRSNLSSLSLSYRLNNLGFGLVQWTPASKLKNWCDDRGLDYTSGGAQCQRIEYERQNAAQWGKNPYAYHFGYTNAPPISFSQFSTSDDDLGKLTTYWALYYERPAEKYFKSSLPDRKKYAEYFYKWLSTVDPQPEVPVPDPPPDPQPTNPSPDPDDDGRPENSVPAGGDRALRQSNIMFYLKGVKRVW